MDWDAILRFARGMIFDGDGVELSSEFARDILFTLATFAIGWMLSLSASKHRLKNRIIDELILSQRELVRRAYPELRKEPWGQMAQRESWMLDPFVARIKFLIASLQEEKSLSLRQLDLLERYVTTLEDFIGQWTKTRNRGAAYHEKYKITYYALRTAVSALGLSRMNRLNGLMPKDSLLDGNPRDTPPPPVADLMVGQQRVPAE